MIQTEQTLHHNAIVLFVLHALLERFKAFLFHGTEKLKQRDVRRIVMRLMMGIRTPFLLRSCIARSCDFRSAVARLSL